MAGCKLLAAIALLLLLVYLCTSASPTHTCRLRLDATSEQQQGFQLSCVQLPGAPADCKLVVYYNSSGTLKDGVTSMAGLIKPPFGVRADQLPSPRAAWQSALFNKTEPQLNRTEPIYKATVWPMLYFHGGPSCNLLMVSPNVTGVQLPQQDYEATAVLAFGGGLRATLQGGSISNTTAFVGVLVLADSPVIINGTTFTNNTVKRGAVYGSWSSTLTIVNTTFLRNKAVEHGGAMYLVGSTARLENNTVFSNVALDGGGGLYVKAGSRLTMEATQVVNNTSPTGGGLAVYEDSTVVIADRSQVTDNTARILTSGAIENYYKLGVGGGVYLERSRVTITDSKLLRNSAVTDGGAGRVMLGQLSISNVEICHNRAYRHGGGFYVGADKGNDSISTTVSITDTLMWNNTAEANGGAMMLERRAFVNISNSSIRDCRAWSDGAGICTVMAGGDGDKTERKDDLKTLLVVDNCTFESRTGDDKLFIGPYHQLQFVNTDMNRATDGVVWRRRLCSRGEYVAPSQLCEACPSYQFSTTEGQPGHSRSSCDAAPSSAYAPGGAVIVPLSGSWHGAEDSARECRGCPRLNASLGDIRRCPHPIACHHNFKALADQHPYSQVANRYSWQEYGALLCNHQEGYSGILCGVCLDGWGSTSPFKCNRCLGVTFATAEGTPDAVVQPGPARISVLYVAYWFVLTVWLLLCVRFSALAPVQQLTKALRSPRTSSAGGSLPPAEHADSASRGSDARSNGQQAPPQQQPAAHKAVTTGQAPSGRGSEISRSLDITKALIIYTQWAMLIINLPVAWLPWTVSSSTAQHTSTPQHSFAGVVAWCVGILFGRAASMDCFLQAWGLLQEHNVQQVVSNVAVRAIGSAIVVPGVLFLSVLLLQLLLSALRKPAVKLLDQLCSRSQFFNRHLATRRAPQPRPQSGSDMTCSVSDNDLESPRMAPANSVSTNSSSQSFLRMTLFGNQAARSAFHRTLADNAVATALAVSMFVYITIARTAFGMLLCVRPGEHSSRRWVLDVRLQCPTAAPFTSWGAAAVVLGVFLLVLCVAWPVGIAVILIHAAQRGKLLKLVPGRVARGSGVGVAAAADSVSAAHTTARLAVRYADYDVAYEALALSPDADSTPGWYRSWGMFKASFARLRLYAVLVWDSILDLHRLTVALVSLLVMLHELHQLILMVLALGSYLLLVLLVKPWRSNDVFRLQVAALAILLASCLGIMACGAGDAGAYYSAVARRRYIDVIPWAVIVANLGYLVLVVVLLVRCVIREGPRLADLRLYLRRRFQMRAGVRRGLR